MIENPKWNAFEGDLRHNPLEPQLLQISARDSEIIELMFERHFSGQMETFIVKCVMSRLQFVLIELSSEDRAHFQRSQKRMKFR